MRRPLLALALIAWCCLVRDARALGWAEMLVDGEPARGMDTQQTSDGGLIVAASRGADPAPWILKLDGAGAIEWQVSCDISTRVSACRVRQVPDGGYVVVGSEFTPDSGPLWIMRLDAAGAVSWQRTYGVGANAQVAGMTLLGSDIVVVGNYNCGNGAAFALRVAGDGAPVWLSAMLPDDVANIHCLEPRAVQVMVDGGIVVAGTLLPTIGSLPGVWYVRLAGDGHIVAEDLRGSRDWPTNVAVVATADGGFLLGGGIQGQGVFLIKYAAGGSIEWEERLTSPDLLMPGGGAMEIAAAPMGGCWIAGRMYDAVGETLLVAHVTADGAIDWQRLFGPHPVEVGSLDSMSDGGLALAGTLFHQGDQQDPVLVAMRLDVSGSADASCGTSWSANLSASPFASELRPLYMTSGLFVPASQSTLAPLSATSVEVQRIGDSHERDDSCSQSRNLKAGATIRHDFCDDAADWYSFDACSGTSYTLATSSLGLATDTVIELYAEDCALQLASDDDGGGGRASRVDWSAPRDGIFFVRVGNRDGSAGPDREYDMTLLRTGAACRSWLSLVEANLCGSASMAPGRAVIVGSRRLALENVPIVFQVEDAGDTISGRQLTGADDGFLLGVEPRPGGGVLVAGCRAGATEGLIAEMDWAGALSWQRALAPARPNAMLRIARRLRDGGLLAVGHVGTPSIDAWIVRLDASGAVTWSRTVGDPDSDERAWEAFELATGGFIVAGQASTVPGAWALRLDEAGAVAWQRSFGTSTAPPIYGGLAMPAAATSAFVIRGGEITHVSDDGTPIWARQLTFTGGTCGAELRDVVATPDGGCAVAGMVDCGETCALLAKLDAAGGLEWSRCMADGPGHWTGYETMSLDSGGFTLTGYGIANARGEAIPFVARVGAQGDGACLERPTAIDGTQAVAAVADTAFVVADMPVIASDPGLVVTPLTLPSEAICGSSAGPESDCANGLDDDSDGEVDCDDADCIDDPACASADADGDGAPNGVDCLPSDATAFAVPPEVSRLLVTRPPASTDAALDWTDMTPFAGSSTTYSVATNLLSELHRIRVASGACLATDLTVPSFVDARDVSSDGFWYLVRAENACGPPAGERWGQDSLGGQRPGCR